MHNSINCPLSSSSQTNPHSAEKVTLIIAQANPSRPIIGYRTESRTEYRYEYRFLRCQGPTGGGNIYGYVPIPETYSVSVPEYGETPLVPEELKGLADKLQSALNDAKQTCIPPEQPSEPTILSMDPIDSETRKKVKLLSMPLGISLLLLILFLFLGFAIFLFILVGAIATLVMEIMLFLCIERFRKYNDRKKKYQQDVLNYKKEYEEYDRLSAIYNEKIRLMNEKWDQLYYCSVHKKAFNPTERKVGTICTLDKLLIDI